ncbi:type II secretion system secretin GspD [Ruegeria sp. HKCCD8929]|uniref:type II secretion system secretin GspD n=1 Tax=Ruegeria sp. HKCCD8929 TaxID=2683006 RepID=UPI001489F735|nr:type II secretion system secretin GspD [Ruegeria sp. HKCCD8929]
MSKTLLGKAMIVVCAFVVSACDPETGPSSGRFGADGPVSSQGSRGFFQSFRGEDQHRPTSLQRGTDTFVNSASRSSKGRSQAIVVPSGKEKVELSLVNASVEAAAKAVLGDTLNITYAVSDQVNGRITIQSTGPIPKQALLELFEAGLAANGAKLERSGNVVKVVPGTSGNRTFRLASDNLGDGASIVVAPLQFVSTGEMINLLEPLVEEGLNLVGDRSRNLLLMSGNPQQLEAALDALNLFDVDVLEGKSIALVRLRSADPDAIVDELNTIFETKEGGNLNGVVEFVPNQRLGSVLIITSRKKYLDRAQKWIRDLDRTAEGSSLYLQTYSLQNRSAEEVAPILNDLLSGSTDSSKNGKAGESKPVPTPGKEVAARVAADNSRNALIVRARRPQHLEIQALLRELDTAARQVLLEATIAEVTLNDTVDVGVRWFFEAGNWDFRFSDLDSGAVAGTNPGFTAVFGTGGAKVALSALASVTDVKVISSPTLMVLDNKEGVLQIGDEVPIATQTSSDTSEGSAVLTQIDYRDTGIILRVKPRIGNSGHVTMDITQEVSDVAETRTSGIDSPTISQRKVQTSVVLSNGQTLALGGLVKEGDNLTRTEVPGLGKVPVVGGLFRRKESTKKRTELLILIRPQVVHNAQAASSATAQWRNKLSGANSILQNGLGSPKHTLDEVLR